MESVVVTIMWLFVTSSSVFAGRPSLDWLGNTSFRNQIARIFVGIGNVDIVLDDDFRTRAGELDQLVWTDLLWGKTVRIYEQPFPEDQGCNGYRPLLSARVQVPSAMEITDTMDRDYEDEFAFIAWDQSYETFVHIWDQNQHSGYVMFGNMTTFETWLRCLLDPLGTYLMVLDGEDDLVGEGAIFELLRSIWQLEGVFRLFILNGHGIHTFDPFRRNGTSYGALVSLTEDELLPTADHDDFNGYPLRVEMFLSTYSAPENDANGTIVDYVGPDVMVSQVLAEAMNCTVKRIKPDKALFGDRLPNGTFSGSIGRLGRHESDIAVVGFFIKDYFSRDIEFTSAVYTDELCCMVKKASRIPEYLLPITIFPPDLWALMVIMGIVSTALWIVLRALIKRSAESRSSWPQRQRLAYLFNLSYEISRAPLYRKLIQISIDTYILLVSGPYQRFTRSGHERLFLFGILMVSLIMVSMFTSGLSSVFVNPVYYKDISSLQQLDEVGYKIPVKYKGFMDDVFTANYSPLMDSLRAKVVFQPSNESSLGRVARIGTISTITRKSTLELDNAIYVTTKQLFMVPECPRLYNLAYVVPRHSVLLEQINGALLRMLNGGLVQHWISEMNFNVTIKDGDMIRSVEESNFKVLTVLDMQFPFYLLSIGLMLSTMVFIVEIIYHQCLQ
ncbi:uncharacterized protein LOC129743594 [Uranotaenia lowii]|uniref:uncharacterized protein LOC129743594 n=1 Tax=Uranotaenia lowii TaxID=190385 RepID=UPI00247A763B|nr:uncharacterized protein LOC129743594 [Uranotaenia lowii]